MPPAILTAGDPAGIGPEISLKAWKAGKKNIVLQGDIAHLKGVAKSAGLEISFTEYDPVRFGETASKYCHILSLKWANRPQAGQPDPDNAPQIIEAIKQAVAQVKAGQFSAIVTNPIAKNTLYEADFSYPGHTEFLAALDGQNAYPVMMLANQALRVVPLTIHIPLNQVETAITEKHLEKTLTILTDALRRQFALSEPHIVVTGLNPHAGEAGHIGRFETDRLSPFLSRFHLEGVKISGPYAADSLFHPQARQGYDAALCMYHDQALIPVKTIDFFGSVNITLGLSFIRTSPDHGTAFDRAAHWNAHPDSLIAAIDRAAQMAINARG